MRTDVKVGLICAFAIVLCVVIYFVARGNGHPSAARAETNTRTTITPPPDPLRSPPAADPLLTDHSLATGGSGSAMGGVIGLPGAGSASAPAPTVTPMGGTGGIQPPAMGPSGGLTVTPAPQSPGVMPLIPSSMPAAGLPRPTLEITAGPSPISLAGATTYKIQKGDMLGTIAKKYNVSVKAIQDANPGIDSTRLKIDAVIKIPAPTAAAGGATSRPAGATGALTGTTTGTPRPTVASTRPATRPAPVAITIKPGSTYTVKKGDTLTTIAKAAYGTTGGWQKIFQANRAALTDPDMVPVGAAIVIP